MAEVPLVSVVIPARDAAATLPRTLDAVLAQDVGAPFEVVVCDDGSADATAQIAATRARLVHSGGHGAAAARNAAVAAARGEILAFTDADCFPRPGWLRAGLAALEDADLVQGPIHAELGAGPFDRTVEFRTGSPWYPTANLFARRDRVVAAGGFQTLALDKDAGGRRQPLGEDTVLAWRLVRDGARRAFAPEAVVVHAAFPCSAREFVHYRRHWRRLPAVARAVPELRRELFVAGLFLEPRTLRFDLAVLALLIARSRPLALAGALPYAWLVAGEAAAQSREPQLRFVAARVAADAVACGALILGSAHARTPVL